MCIIERNSRNITVRITNKRWNRLMELENAYRTAQAVLKAKSECESAPALTVDQALDFIDTL